MDSSSTVKARTRQGYEWLRQQLSLKGVTGIAVILYSAVPDWQGRNEYWVHHWPTIRSLLSDNSRVILIVIGLLVIWWDHARLIRSRGPRPHDPRTLKGRTLRLRDELKAFLEQVGSKPAMEYNSDMERAAYLKTKWEVVGPWMDKLTYGYERRFSDAVRKIYLEYGERSLLPGIGLDLPNGLPSESQVNEIIDGLGKLAEKVDD